MYYKKISLLTLSFLIAAMSLTGCGANTTENNSTSSQEVAENNVSSNSDSISANTADTQAKEEKTDANTASEDKSLNIVCTIFPEYDWVKEILGSHAENDTITYLLDNGVDLHSYQPTTADMAKIAQCDLFVYVGGESDEWVEDALAEAVNPDMQVINLMEIMGDSAKFEELKEGMQEEEHDYEHDHSKEVSTFEDDEVQDRSLSDWEGEWQSGYPLALNGSLDEAFEHKAESGSMTAQEYKDYYIKGYETDYDYIKIEGNHITFKKNDGTVTESDYEDKGYFIQDWSTGTRAAMYRFEAVDKESGAPVYIEFNDHMIEPEKAEHFHFRMSDESYDAIVDPENRFPTYYPASLTPDEVCEELAGHGSHNEDEEGEEHEHHHEEGEEEYDEHVWLSLKNAKLLCTEITDKLCILDSDSTEDYKANLKAYAEQLDKLDSDFQALVDSASVKTLIFGDRFPFRYFVDDYGLDYYAAFVGCSAESEASFETIVFLSDKVNALHVSTVFTIENSDQKIAKTIVENTNDKNQSIAVLNSLQSVTSQQIADGVNYLSLMQENYDVLKENLN